MQTKAATALYDYWTRQRGRRAMPLRGAIEPADIAAILPDVFILEGGRLGGTSGHPSAREWFTAHRFQPRGLGAPAVSESCTAFLLSV